MDTQYSSMEASSSKNDAKNRVLYIDKLLVRSGSAGITFTCKPTALIKCLQNIVQQSRAKNPRVTLLSAKTNIPAECCQLFAFSHLA